MVDRNGFQYFKNWYGMVRSDDLEGTLLEQEKLRLFYDWIIGQNGCLFSNQYNMNRLFRLEVIHEIKELSSASIKGLVALQRVVKASVVQHQGFSSSQRVRHLLLH